MAAATTSYDRRRINAPETLPLIFASSSNAATSLQAPATSKRNVRKPHPLFVQTGLVRQANGSVYLESEHVKIACSVYGPRQAHAGSGGGGAGGAGTAASAGTTGGGAGSTYTDEAEINVDVRFASFATPQRRRKPGRDAESPRLASAIRAALLPSVRLNLLPKAAIDIFITVLEADAGLGRCAKVDADAAVAAAAATAASCAMADAGIELWGLVVGTHAVLLPSVSADEGLIVDASSQEARGATSALILWSMPALGSVTLMEQLGSISLEAMKEMISTLQTASTEIHYTVAKALKDGHEARTRS